VRVGGRIVVNGFRDDVGIAVFALSVFSCQLLSLLMDLTLTQQPSINY
jgi:hypothetical protein